MSLRYCCDLNRHLICLPYSVANLHQMAQALGLKRCWFHRDHYDIPQKRKGEIEALCQASGFILSKQEIVYIIQNSDDSDHKTLPIYGTRFQKHCPRWLN